MNLGHSTRGEISVKNSNLVNKTFEALWGVFSIFTFGFILDTYVLQRAIQNSKAHWVLGLKTQTQLNSSLSVHIFQKLEFGETRNAWIWLICFQTRTKKLVFGDTQKTWIWKTQKTRIWWSSKCSNSIKLYPNWCKNSKIESRGNSIMLNLSVFEQSEYFFNNFIIFYYSKSKIIRK